MLGRRSKAAVVVGLIGGAYTLLVRPRLLRWGASDAEVASPYAGDDLVPGGRRTSTMATTISAPPSRVWPWLVQMGRDRAGWYSWDRLDNGGRPSGERIHPEWQAIKVGDRMAATESGSTWFEVAAVEPERFLALRAALDLHGRSFDTAGRRPRYFSDSAWCFQLTESPRERTRMVVTCCWTARPRLLFGAANLLFWEPAHAVMQVRQFANLNRRAVSLPPEGVERSGKDFARLIQRSDEHLKSGEAAASPLGKPRTGGREHV